jgi:hypothetical protein
VVRWSSAFGRAAELRAFPGNPHVLVLAAYAPSEHPAGLRLLRQSASRLYSHIPCASGALHSSMGGRRSLTCFKAGRHKVPGLTGCTPGKRQERKALQMVCGTVQLHAYDWSFAVKVQRSARVEALPIQTAATCMPSLIDVTEAAARQQCETHVSGFLEIVTHGLHNTGSPGRRGPHHFRHKSEL